MAEEILGGPIAPADRGRPGEVMGPEPGDQLGDRPVLFRQDPDRFRLRWSRDPSRERIPPGAGTSQPTPSPWMP
jgi:hypothetical protein